MASYRNQQLPEDGELAKAVYLRLMSAMKEILNMGEFRIGKRGSSEYRYFKKVVMDEIYTSMNDLFESLEGRGILRTCECGSEVRNGYNKECAVCNGAGYRNSNEFAEWEESEADELTEEDDNGDDQAPEGGVVS